MTNFERTSKALAEYDSSTVFDTYNKTYEELKVLNAFAEDTKTFNDRTTVMGLLRVGPKVPLPGFELSLIRQCVNEWLTCN